MRDPVGAEIKGLLRTLWWRRALRVIVRSMWLALLVPCIGFALRLLMGWPVSLRQMAPLIVAVLIYGVVRASVSSSRPEVVAHQLDSRLQLQDMLVTAYETAQKEAEPGVVEARLLDSPRDVVGRLRENAARRPRLPRRELETLVAVAFLTTGFAIMTLPGPTLEPRDPRPLPPAGVEAGGSPDQSATRSPPADMAPAANPEPGPSAQRALQRLADALRDPAVTRAAAAALDQGDTRGAARELRALADQVGGISPQARGELADAARAAATDVRADAPDLASQLERTARGLEEGERPAAAELEGLAREVEKLGGSQQPEQAPGPAQGGRGVVAQYFTPN